jgi:hypothetical protein
MDTSKIITAIGGRKKVIEMTGLTRATISYWVTNNRFPKPWLKFFQTKYPRLNWKELLAEGPESEAAEPVIKH